MAYARAPYYAQYAPLIEEYFKDPDPSLINRNMRFIRAVMEILDIRTRIITSSSLEITSKSTQLLVDLLKEIGADTYLCGDGACGYQQDKLFSDNGIILEKSLDASKVSAITCRTVRPWAIHSRRTI